MSGQRVAIGLIVAPVVSEGLARQLADNLSERLRSAFPRVHWKVELDADAACASLKVNLHQRLRRRMLEKGWHFVLCLSDLPLRTGGEPVVAEVSRALGVGVVSVPTLGALEIERRIQDTSLRVLNEMIGGPAVLQRAPSRPPEPFNPVDAYFVSEPREALGTVTGVTRGQLRLLMGMIRANRPWRLVFGLPRAWVAALAVAAVALLSPVIWKIAGSMSWARLLCNAAGAVLLASATLIARNGLWERTPTPNLRARVLLVNFATAKTVVLGILVHCLFLFLLTGFVGLALITVEAFQSEVRHVVGFIDYLQLAGVVSALGTLAVAVGAAMEEVETVRAAAYGFREAHLGEAVVRRRARIRRPALRHA